MTRMTAQWPDRHNNGQTDNTMARHLPILKNSLTTKKNANIKWLIFFNKSESHKYKPLFNLQQDLVNNTHRVEL